jgi:hypothetical protein
MKNNKLKKNMVKKHHCLFLILPPLVVIVTAFLVHFWTYDTFFSSGLGEDDAADAVADNLEDRRGWI